MKFIISLITIFILDQFIKYIFIDGFRFESNWISLILVYNKGVAFSMFSFLEEYLKYLQLILLGAIVLFFKKENLFFKHPIISGMLLGAGISNIFDRFIHNGVVDYVYYHGLFEFAVFNFADVIIDFSMAMLFWSYWRENEKNSNK